MWEKLVLDGFQAGLSWITILKKRENFRAAFAGFDPATIGNARAYLEIDAAEGFGNFLWRYVDGQPLQNNPATMADVPARTTLSEQISKDLKNAGFRFCGPTIVYAFMQAVGMVNDHVVTCHRHGELAG